MQVIPEGDMKQCPEVRSKDEIGDLVCSFNRGVQDEDSSTGPGLPIVKKVVANQNGNMKSEKPVSA